MPTTGSIKHPATIRGVDPESFPGRRALLLCHWDELRRRSPARPSARKRQGGEQKGGEETDGHCRTFADLRVLLRGGCRACFEEGPERCLKDLGISKGK